VNGRLRLGNGRYYKKKEGKEKEKMRKGKLEIKIVEEEKGKERME
jgi:hypothetical protein